MSKLHLPDWKLAQKLQESKYKGVIIGLAIAALVITITVLIIVKIRLMKKSFDCLHCDLDELGEDFVDGEGCDENGCCYTSEKDFV